MLLTLADSVVVSTRSTVKILAVAATNSGKLNTFWPGKTVTDTDTDSFIRNRKAKVNTI